jgi:hypothetical protein
MWVLHVFGCRIMPAVVALRSHERRVDSDHTQFNLRDKINDDRDHDGHCDMSKTVFSVDSGWGNHPVARKARSRGSAMLETRNSGIR